MSRALSTCIVICFWASSASADTIGFLKVGDTYTSIAYPGAKETFATAINNRGEIAGWFVDGTSAHGFLFSGGKYTAIDYPNADRTRLYAINDVGDIVGDYYDFDPNPTSGAFVFDGSTFTPVAIPYPNGSVDDINNAGQMVGSYFDGGWRGYVLSGATYDTVLYPGAEDTMVIAINNAGDIAGVFGDHPYPTHGFIKTGDGFTQVDSEPFRLPPVALSDTGFILFAQNQIGILWDGNEYSRLLRPDFIDDEGQTYLVEGTFAQDVNNAGHVVGYTSGSIKPVPDGEIPLAFPMLLFGLAVLIKHRG